MSGFIDRSQSSTLPTRERERLEPQTSQRGTPPRSPERRPSYFISYSHDDSAEADHIEVLLRRKPRPVWRDLVNIRASENIKERIRMGIDAADTFLALWSTAYLTSRSCQQELRAARSRSQGKSSGLGDRRFRLTVIKLDDTELPGYLKDGLHLLGRMRIERLAAVERLINEDGEEPAAGSWALANTTAQW